MYRNGRLDELSYSLKRKAKIARGARKVGAAIKSGTKKVVDSSITTDVGKGIANVAGAAKRTALGGLGAGKRQIDRTAGSVSKKIGSGQGKEAAKEAGRGAVRTARDTAAGAYKAGGKELKGLAKKSEKYALDKGKKALSWTRGKISKGLDNEK